MGNGIVVGFNTVWLLVEVAITLKITEIPETHYLSNAVSILTNLVYFTLVNSNAKRQYNHVKYYKLGSTRYYSVMSSRLSPSSVLSLLQ